MAIDFIKIDTGLSTQIYAAEFKRLIEDTKKVKEGWLRFQAIMGHLNDGGDFTKIPVVLGLVNIADGQAPNGQGVKNIGDGMVTALSVPAVNTVTGGMVG